MLSFQLSNTVHDQHEFACKTFDKNILKANLEHPPEPERDLSATGQCPVPRPIFSHPAEAAHLTTVSHHL